MNKSKLNNSRPVWSSELGRICPECEKQAVACICKKKTIKQASDGIVRIRRETKGRGGKTMTVVMGVPLDDEKLKALAGELKRRCGTGGTMKDGVIEIQGDHCDMLVADLTARGFTVKRAGG